MNQATLGESVMTSVLPFPGRCNTRMLCPGPWRILTRSAAGGDRSEFRIDFVADGSTREGGIAGAITLQVARWEQAGDNFRMEQLAASGLLFVYSGTIVAPKYVQGAYYTPDDANLGGTFVAWRLDSVANALLSDTLAMATA